MNKLVKRAALLFTILSSLAFAAQANAISILATTGHIGDAVHNIAPNADVTVLVGPGGDPHHYEPSTKDIKKMRSVDIVLWNGLYLEAQMERAIQSLGDKQLELGAKVPTSMLLPWEDNLYDPHIWNSAEVWSLVVRIIAGKLSEIDPSNAPEYQRNAERYVGEILAADAYAREKLGAIPEQNRTLISGHDAFQYFASSYKLKGLAIEGVSTEDEASLKDLRKLADYIADNKVPAIFYENITDPQATVALQEAVKSRGFTVKIADEELYSDALGDSKPVDTFLGSFRHNVDAIYKALGGA
ncbi:metal ABC transporter solute-binding protein, Zn/Mn family [Vibrio nigripulchritudo]|uniref:metal ABC transporter solute-binding protein, Zn/Mn family n=1 Tax=Vibrio nigripulchritudo TaxID=28173 RepID=UPI0024915CE3|nr:zinc ABC transporter substrate-binding protein [Vibrio nigripulchritudo]BDU39707.1 manganese transporter [Vibrio nigripulchritudo]BDU45430.1 manganese transporter [Vibrio nigripulchritudo]